LDARNGIRAPFGISGSNKKTRKTPALKRKNPALKKRVIAAAAKVQRLLKIPPEHEGTGQRDPFWRNSNMLARTSGALKDQYQTPCCPVRIAIRNARKQIPQNNTVGSSVLSDFSDEDIDADMGAKM
jgi:hypothetical protein